MINGAYNEKTDIWSLGVILYILLSGDFPFKGKGKLKNNVYQIILKKNLDFSNEEWCHIKPSGISLVKSMLNKNMHERPSAEQCLKHQWFSSFKKDTKDIMSQEAKNSNTSLLQIFKKANQKLTNFNVCLL